MPVFSCGILNYKKKTTVNWPCLDFKQNKRRSQAEKTMARPD